MGLDISSTAIGWSIIDKVDGNMKLVDSGYVKPTKKGSMFDRLIDAEAKVKKIVDQFKPDCVGIEDIAKFFPKRSSANTIITLALFNRTIGLMCVKSGYEVRLCNVMSIRHSIKTGKKAPKKEEIPDLVSIILNFKYPWKMSRTGKRIAENYDMADGIAVGIYLYKLLELERLRPLK